MHSTKFSHELHELHECFFLSIRVIRAHSWLIRDRWTFLNENGASGNADELTAVVGDLDVPDI